MKPSERIGAWVMQRASSDDRQWWVAGILAYLDEQHEARTQPLTQTTGTVTRDIAIEAPPVKILITGQDALSPERQRALISAIEREVARCLEGAEELGV